MYAPLQPEQPPAIFVDGLRSEPARWRVDPVGRDQPAGREREPGLARVADPGDGSTHLGEVDPLRPHHAGSERHDVDRFARHRPEGITAARRRRFSYHADMPSARPWIYAAFVACALRMMSCESLEEVCTAIEPGERFADARARLAATSAKYYPPSQANSAHMWREPVGFKLEVGVCRVWADADRVRARSFTWERDLP
jgi:hypothetical protein